MKGPASEKCSIILLTDLFVKAHIYGMGSLNGTDAGLHHAQILSVIIFLQLYKCHIRTRNICFIFELDDLIHSH